MRGCQTFQIHTVGSIPQRQSENRITLTHASMSKLSCDIKHMYGANTGHRFIHVVADERTNYSV